MIILSTGREAEICFVKFCPSNLRMRVLAFIVFKMVEEDTTVALEYVLSFFNQILDSLRLFFFFLTSMSFQNFEWDGGN